MARWVRLLLLAGLCSGVTVAAACAAAVMTTVTEWVSLLIEPLSLLLLPGLVAALGWKTALGQTRHAGNFGNSHDFSANFVVVCSVVFYFCVFVLVLIGARRRAGAGEPR